MMRKYYYLWSLTMLFILYSGNGYSQQAKSEFLNPPQIAKPQTWWHWMHGNVSKEGITADLEAMHKAGLGGAQIFDVTNGIPKGSIDYMSSEWRELIKHASSEAHRLGLELTIHNCAGWSTSGGPWITPEHSMQRVVWSETIEKGPNKATLKLPQPFTVLDYYKDIAVYAFKTPLGDDVRLNNKIKNISSDITDFNGDLLVDNDLGSMVMVPGREGEKYILFEFTEPVDAQSIQFRCNKPWGGFTAALYGWIDNEYQKLVDLSMTGEVEDSKTMMYFSRHFKPVRSDKFKLVFGQQRSQNIPLAEVEFIHGYRIDGWGRKTATHRMEAPAFSNITDIDSKYIIVKEGIVDLTKALNPDGTLEWNVPEGKWTILRMGHTTTGMTNLPASEEGKGLECDKMSKEALDIHLDNMLMPLIDFLGTSQNAIKFSLIDSYEARAQNWTPRFREHFIRFRGYDPYLYLPTLTGRVVGSVDISERFLWDFRRTIADLYAENYYGYFVEQCHKMGIQSYVEGYGMGIFDNLMVGGRGDIPMSEFWTTGQIGGSYVNRSNKLMSSAAHIYGKNIVAAESFTAMPGIGSWKNHPYVLKALGDYIYTLGVNRLIFHRFAHQPWLNVKPGMTMGFWGSHFDRTNTWWDYMSGWTNYLSRSQYMLQKGQFVADICYFTGEDAPADLPGRNNLEYHIPYGYDYDGLSAEILLNSSSVKDGKIHLQSGMEYKLLTIPKNQRLTPELLEKIAQLVKEGATVYGPKPELSPSLRNFSKSDDKVRQLADSVWGYVDGVTVNEHNCGKGKVVWGRTLPEVLVDLDIKPDFEYKAANGAELNYIHRQEGETDIYFIANRKDRNETTLCIFRIEGKVPELWYADDGRRQKVENAYQIGTQTYVPINFAPSGSVFVVFKNSIKQPSTKPFEIRGSWELTFPAGLGAPPNVTLSELQSWTENEDFGIRHFSGTATYTKEFNYSNNKIHKGDKIHLNLGEVNFLASVKLNGKDLGDLWKPPYRVEITDALKKGKNKLEIKTTNLWVNRLIGDEYFPSDVEYDSSNGIKEIPEWVGSEAERPVKERVTFATWKFYSKDSPLIESGLLGPVTIEVERE